MNMLLKIEKNEHPPNIQSETNFTAFGYHVDGAIRADVTALLMTVCLLGRSHLVHKARAGSWRPIDRVDLKGGSGQKDNANQECTGLLVSCCGLLKALFLNE
jgi:hypothetical protein